MKHRNVLWAIGIIFVLGAIFSQVFAVKAEDQQQISNIPTYELNIGNYLEFTIEDSPENQGFVAPQSKNFICEEIPSSQEGERRFRLTTLCVGNTQIRVFEGEAIKEYQINILPSSIRLDTSKQVNLQTGGIYGFTVTLPSDFSGELQVEAEGLELRQIPRTDLPENMRYYEITALKTGNFRVNVSDGTDIAAFPVSVQESSMEKKAQSYQSATNYLILTDLEAQKVGVFQKSGEKWVYVKSYFCSSGKQGYETPQGEFKVQSKGSCFFNRSLGEGAQWWTSFLGDYLFHTFPMDAQKNVTDTRLGQPLSHGCVRLRIEDAKWIYDNVPIGSKVVVYSGGENA